MSDRTKQLLAGLLVLGVAGVWGTRVAGIDPVAFLRGEELPLEYEQADVVDVPSPEAPGSPQRGASISVDSVADLVRFLETRERGRKPSGGETVRVESKPADASAEETGAPAGDLRAVLDLHPLRAIVHGAAGASATFGRDRLRVGDRLPAGEFTVAAIERGAVRLSSPEGDFLVELPALGGGTSRAALLRESESVRQR